MAMGSAVTAVAEGSASVLWNPAALTRMSRSEFGLHSEAGLGHSVDGTLIYGKPMGAWGGIAASLGYVTYGTFQGRDALGNPTSTYNGNNLSGSLGWGIELLPGLSGGATVKLDQQTLADSNYSSFAADLGLLWKVSSNFDLGLTYSNIALGNGFAGSPLTKGWRVGAGWTLNKRLLLAAAGELENGGMNRIQMGGEYLIGDVEKLDHILALRAGYQFNMPDPQISGFTDLTLGLGYTLTRSWTLDYAMVPKGEVGVSHLLSLTLKLD
jgi:hypothetical protein